MFDQRSNPGWDAGQALKRCLLKWDLNHKTDVRILFPKPIRKGGNKGNTVCENKGVCKEQDGEDWGDEVMTHLKSW